MTRTQTSLFDLQDYDTPNGQDWRYDTLGHDPTWDTADRDADHDADCLGIKANRRGIQSGGASGWITHEDKLSKQGVSRRYYAYRWFLSTGRCGYRAIAKGHIKLVREMIERGDAVSDILRSMPVRRSNRESTTDRKSSGLSVECDTPQ